MEGLTEITLRPAGPADRPIVLPLRQVTDLMEEQHGPKGFGATCLPLTDILPRDRTVHVLSVDAEGAEALRVKYNFEKERIWSWLTW